ncbi:MAG TPA: TerB family tellurite resistance protein [Polyangiaceae bacterium]|jgi:uncharacterized tellurite resistance protein B-like protein|nr:TerB family tellurite resistance protein [Polyangiaceae bacterium]
MFRWLVDKIAASPPQGTGGFAGVVRANMVGTDEETVRIVVAMAGLLGTVAYADRRYGPEEEQRIRQELERVEALTPSGIDAVCAALREHIVDISTIEAPFYARELLTLTDRDLRLQVLDALVDLAAADNEITVVETNLLRLTASALGLTQDDYNACQARHKDKLAVLRR